MPSLDALGTLSLKAVVAQSAWTIDGFFLLPRATTWQRFRTNLSSESIGLNFLFSDTTGSHGHIGYQMAGLAPQRSMDDTLVPVLGSDGTHEWTGYATFNQLPSVYNPPGHLLETVQQSHRTKHLCARRHPDLHQPVLRFVLER